MAGFQFQQSTNSIGTLKTKPQEPSRNGRRISFDGQITQCGSELAITIAFTVILDAKEGVNAFIESVAKTL